MSSILYDLAGEPLPCLRPPSRLRSGNRRPGRNRRRSVDHEPRV